MREWKYWHANNLECDEERIPTGQSEPEEEVAQVRSMVLGRMARINNIKGKGKVFPLQARCGPDGG
jgi:hypothetical protein